MCRCDGDVLLRVDGKGDGADERWFYDGCLGSC